MGFPVQASMLTVLLSLALLGQARAMSTPGLRPLPKNPLLFQINTRVRIDELTKAAGRQATLDDFPEAELESLAAQGYDFAYFLGVWQTGEYGMKKSIKLLDLEPCMKGLPREAACSSPFAVIDYSVHSDFGGDQALQRLKERCHKYGLRLMVDLVPNHMAVDHPWTSSDPNLLIQGNEPCIGGSPQNFFRKDGKIFAHGKDMYYDGWEDTVQINYGHPRAREEMCKVLCKMASLSDGVRCDMAMLLCEDILEKTWNDRLNPWDGTPRARGEFWPPTIQAAKKVNPGFTFVAECYWDREYQLHTFGFDFAYDKTLYDRLKELDVGKVRGHLMADLGYQSKLVRFLENHDEERAADSWKETSMHMAAAVISFTIPGMHFIHDGQQEGRVKRISMHVNCRQKLEHDVKDKNIAGKYAALIKAHGCKAIHDVGSDWRGCTTTPSQDGNPSHEHMVAHVNWKDQEAALTVVNFFGEYSNGHVILPAKHFGYLRGKKVKLTDMLSDCVIEKPGDVLLGEHGGLWFNLKPWQSHLFKVSF